MKRTRSLKAVVRGASISVLVLLAFCTMVAPRAVAKPRHSKPADPPVTIVAHLLLQEGPVTQMFVGEQKRERKWKQYLYIEQASKEGLTIVDVTNPAQPNVTNEVGWPKDASTDKLQLVGNNLALSTVREENSGAVAALDPPTESVSVLDVSHPANPQRLYSFSGVTSVLLDDERNLIYITNSEGLWILRHKQEQPVDPCPGIGGCA
jgi:LVIVD repeat